MEVKKVNLYPFLDHEWILAALHGYALRAPFYRNAKMGCCAPQPANSSFAAAILIPQKSSMGKIRKSITDSLSNASAGGTVLVSLLKQRIISSHSPFPICRAARYRPPRPAITQSQYKSYLPVHSPPAKLGRTPCWASSLWLLISVVRRSWAPPPPPPHPPPKQTPKKKGGDAQ